MVNTNIAAAIICFLGQCHPAIVGERTPRGEFTLVERRVLTPGYGGDVLQFHEDEDIVYAVHRLWLGRPEENRPARLHAGAEQRRITRGCINVSPEVYDALKACCVGKRIVIK